MSDDRTIIALALLIGLVITSGALSLLLLPRIPKPDLRKQAAAAAKRLTRDSLLALEVEQPEEGQQLTALYIRRPYGTRPTIALVDTGELIRRGGA